MIDVERTVGAAIEAAAGTLRSAGIDEPRREAERLWGGLRREGRSAAILARNEALVPGDERAYADAVRRRAAGEPLAYVTGWCGFRMLELRVDRRALIPRPETELLVELLLRRVSSGTVADIGTGTGCIALSLLTEGRFDRVHAVDASPAALALARENAALVGSSPHFVRGHLATALAADSCDALISNPPYLTVAEHAALEPAVRDWEPPGALASGPDGMRATEGILTDGIRAVRAGGWIALELDAARAQLAGECAAAAGWIGVSIINDLFGRERYLLAQRSEA
ncbi:MAG TPA: peptide chain release factor N(5)-glutamine methyltransferase [Gemmatimonadales bacterium]|nr:peptide chain release factor N(5)-glutamine methyltransferase [Gemmatimonadales bacterium]